MIKVGLFILCIVLAKGQDCVWDKDADFPTDNPPLLVNLQEWRAYLPVQEGALRVVRVTDGSTVVVACPGSTIAIGGEVAEGDCIGGDFIIDGNNYSIGELACADRVDDNAFYSLTGETCGNGNIGRVASIGFDVPGYQFYETINVCFEEGVKIPIYAKHVVYGASVEAADDNPDRPEFQMGTGFYDYDPNECYLTAPQEEYYNDLLGDPTFIDTSTSTYFSRGHLAPNAAFFTEMEADATFYYINVIPQWQDYNAQNWAYLEASVRDLAQSHGSDIQVWTGPWNNLVVDDINGNPQTLYHCGSQGDQLIPVPELIWKVVYEESSNSGLAIITSNRPHETEVPTPICENIGCETATWIDIFYPEDLDRGYTYCCTVEDLQAVNPNVPDLGTLSPLLS